MSLIRQLTKGFTWSQTFTNVDHARPFFWRGASGVRVGRERAMRISTVWSCVTVKAEDIGSLPVKVVEQQGRNRVPKALPTWLQKPNPELTRFGLFEQTSACLDLDGNAYWFLVRDLLGRVQEVWVLPPSQVQPYRDPPKVKGGPPGPKRFWIGAEDYGMDEVLHVPGFTLPGHLRGLNPIEHHAHTLGLAAAAEEYGEAFFGNAATQNGLMKFKADPGPVAARRMQESFAKDHTGLHNAHKPGILFGDVEWVPLTIPNDAAQFLETRKYQRTEICGIYRVPPHKIGDLERATFSNIEQQEINYAVDGLQPRTSRIEAAVFSAGILDEPTDQLRFAYQGRLRGDTTARYAAYAIARQWGWLSVDDIRDLEDLSPLPDGAGGNYLEPLNMRVVGDEQAAADVVPVSKLLQAKSLLDSGLDPHAAFLAAGIDSLQLVASMAAPTITEG